MSGELHEDVVAFEPVSLGRETIMLGKVHVGEIMPSGESGRACFRLTLPEASATSWRPCGDLAEARRLAAIKINDWLNAAGLRPDGGA